MEGIRYWIETEGAGHWFFIAFPVVLICLFLWFKGRRVRFLIPSLLISLVIINPWFYQKWDELGLYAYWRILWVVPVIPVVAGIVPSITERIGKTWVKAVVAAVGVGLIVFGGTFLYNGTGGSFVEAANAAKLPEYVVKVADRLLELDEHPRVIAQDPIGVYLRQYSGKISTIFGRDIHGYILKAESDSRNIFHSINNDEFIEISQFMLDDGYDYLIYSNNPGDTFKLIDKVGEYGLFQPIGKQTVKKERNELGQVIAITSIDEQGKAISSSIGYTTACLEYNNEGRICEEIHISDESKSNNPITGYRWSFNTHGQVIDEQQLDMHGNYVYSNHSFVCQVYTKTTTENESK